MTVLAKSIVHAAAALVVLAAGAAAGAQVPGPERLEVVRTADGPRVRLAGVGVGTPYPEASRRLGGPGVLGAFFGGGPIMTEGAVGGTSCRLAVLFDRAQRVERVDVRCDGSRAALDRLAGQLRAALTPLPRIDGEGSTAYGDDSIGLLAVVRVVPADEDGWWGRTFGPRQLRLSILR